MYNLKIYKMKNSIRLIAISLFVFGIHVSGQELVTDSREVFGFGLKAGVNYSNVWDEEGQDFRADPKVGFAGGVFASIPLGKFIGVQPELMLSQKGFQGSGTIIGTPYSFSRTTTFLDIPLLLQVKPAKFVTIVLGPQYSFLLRQKDVYTFGSNSVEQEEEFENENIRKNILGLTGGADFHVYKFVISGRVGWDFQSNRGDGTSFTPRYKNQWLQLTVGYKF